jgi:hypothetical protein
MLGFLIPFPIKEFIMLLQTPDMAAGASIANEYINALSQLEVRAVSHFTRMLKLRLDMQQLELQALEWKLYLLGVQAKKIARS